MIYIQCSVFFLEIYICRVNKWDAALKSVFFMCLVPLSRQVCHTWSCIEVCPTAACICLRFPSSRQIPSRVIDSIYPWVGFLSSQFCQFSCIRAYSLRFATAVGFFFYMNNLHIGTPAFYACPRRLGVPSHYTRVHATLLDTKGFCKS